MAAAIALGFRFRLNRQLHLSTAALVESSTREERARATATQTAERADIARKLHDSLGPQATIVSMYADIVKMLKTNIDDSTAFWTQLLERSQILKKRIDELEASLEEMNVAERFTKFIGNRGASTGNALEQLKSAYTTTMESERKIMKGFHSLIETAEKTRKELDAPPRASNSEPPLVYWKDEAGTHSFVTDQLRLA